MLPRRWAWRACAPAVRPTSLPIVAIGGIDVASTAAIIEAGADGIAVVSAICAAPDPERAARDLARAVRAAR